MISRPCCLTLFAVACLLHPHGLPSFPSRLPALLSVQSPVLNPRLSSPALLRYLDALASPYQDLAKAYRKGTSAQGGGGGASASGELAHLVDLHGATFVHDKNLGLVKQLMRAAEKKQITRLTQTYLTFSLDDIAAHINLAPQQQNKGNAAAAQQPAQLAERYVFDMVRGQPHSTASRLRMQLRPSLGPPTDIVSAPLSLSLSLLFRRFLVCRSAPATFPLGWTARRAWSASWASPRSTTPPT